MANELQAVATRLIDASPSVATILLMDGSYPWSQLGFATDDEGWAWLGDLGPEPLEEFKADWGQDWTPIAKGTEVVEHLGIYGIEFRMGNDVLAEAGPSSGMQVDSKMMLTLTDEYLIGSCAVGNLAVGYQEDGTLYKRPSRPGTKNAFALQFCWALTDIRSIAVVRQRTMLGVQDVRFHLAGDSRAENPASLSARTVSDPQTAGDFPTPTKSDALNFSYVLAATKAKRDGIAVPAWEEHKEGKRTYHELAFA